jgi:PIN domain nuclease of toxin-antitoxin system
LTPRRTPTKRPARPHRTTRVGEARAAPYVAERLLLDTHVWLWWQADDRRLGSRARHAIATATDVRFSVASAWEIMVKARLGKLALPANSSIRAELDVHGFQAMAIELAHAEAIAMLPPIHRDPFDRMLVAQAMTEGLTIVTADRVLSRYDVAILAATE